LEGRSVQAVADLDFRRHAQDLRRTWQAGALAQALIPGEFTPPRDKIGMCMLSVLAHNYSDPREDALAVLLRVVFPAFKSIGAPFLCSAAKIAKTGHVMADMIARDGHIVKNQALFRSTKQMEGEFRKFADGLRLDDAEREELFAAVKRWVVCDYRLDPQMDPADPDAARLTVN
jgi:hypothetical protein